MELVLLRSTYASEADAQAAAAMLIQKRLAACAHVQALWSTYRWKGKIESGTEWQLEAKVVEADRDVVWEMLLDRHPYTTPCVEVATVQVPARYGAWAKRVTSR